MAPRAYNNETRQQQQAQLRQRIVEATVRLHAEKGALATSYADIAQSAGVSLPTVYKHFPQLDDLFRSCTGHVAAAAPPFPADRILGAASLALACELLVAAIDQTHAHFEPWLVWRERTRIQVVADISEARRKEVTELCFAVLARHAVAGERRLLAAAWESLLNFELWHRLVREHKLARTAVRSLLQHLLLAVTGPHPATQSSSRPTRKKSPS